MAGTYRTGPRYRFNSSAEFGGTWRVIRRRVGLALDSNLFREDINRAEHEKLSLFFFTVSTHLSVLQSSLHPSCIMDDSINNNAPSSPKLQHRKTGLFDDQEATPEPRSPTIYHPVVSLMVHSNTMRDCYQIQSILSQCQVNSKMNNDEPFVCRTARKYHAVCLANESNLEFGKDSCA